LCLRPRDVSQYGGIAAGNVRNRRIDLVKARPDQARVGHGGRLSTDGDLDGIRQDGGRGVASIPMLCAMMARSSSVS